MSGTDEGVTVSMTLSSLAPPTEVLAYLPAGVSLTDAAKIARALARAYPGATAQTADIPAGMAMAILRPVKP